MAKLRVRIRGKMLSSFIVITLLGAVSSVIGMIGLLQMNQVLKTMYEIDTKPVLSLVKISNAYQRVGILVRDAVLASSDAEANKSIMTLDGEYETLKGNLEDFKTGLETADLKDGFAQFETKLDEYEGLVKTIVDLPDLHTNPAVAGLLKDLKGKSIFLQTMINNFTDTKTDGSAQRLESSTGRMNVSLLVSGALMLLSILASLILGFLFSSSLTRSIRSIGHLAAEVAGGTLTGTLKTTIIRRSDELGELGRSVETMKGNILTNLSDVKSTVTVLEGISEELDETMSGTLAAIDGIKAGIDTVNQQILDQGAGVTETSATVDSILSNIAHLNEEIESQSASVTQSSASIEQMVMNIEAIANNVNTLGEHFAQLEAASQKGNALMQSMSRDVAGISDQSENLSSANLVVAKIAAQTNLLAMNAAIEAAHAGEQGKGFAVVAEEIRHLAESSSLQSKEISTDIKNIRANISSVVQLSEDSGKAFLKIMEMISEVARLEQEIRHALVEQSQGSKEVLEAIADMNSAASRVRSESSEIHEGSQSIATEMQGLLKSSQTLREAAEDIVSKTVEIEKAAQNARGLSENSVKTVEELRLGVAHYQI